MSDAKIYWAVEHHISNDPQRISVCADLEEAEIILAVYQATGEARLMCIQEVPMPLGLEEVTKKLLTKGPMIIRTNPRPSRE